MRSSVRVFLVVGAAVLALAPTAAAAPGVGKPTVVTVGDSAISGEAGRWAGNTNQSASKADALGSTAYWDTPTGEAISGCHRSRAAQAYIGLDGSVDGVNLACSGARTSTTGTGSGQTFKPGIDFYGDSSGRKGQARMLQEVAAARNVKAVVVMIGANNYGFAAIVERCVTNWLTSPSWWKNYCSDDSDMTSRFTAARQAQETANVSGAFQRVAQAMANAGYQPGQYTIIAQTYWSPIPRGSGFRYAESGWTRQSIGGCGTWNRDANWANDTVVEAMNRTVREGVAASGVTNYAVLDLRDSLVGRRLCETGVGLLEEAGLSSWRSAGAVDRTEWVSQIRTVTTIVGPYQLQEGGHASYWGQLAMRNCLRLAYNGGAVRGGSCVRVANGLNALGEPQMGLR
jgi:hypothetical protein